MEDIIKTLHIKNKYDSWIKYGSCYGYISSDSKINIFNYTNIDGNIVKVSSVATLYKSLINIESIPVFEFINEDKSNEYSKCVANLIRCSGKMFESQDSTFVSQRNYKIVNINEKLNTRGLSTCTGISIIFKNKKFLAHIDSESI